MTSEFDNLRGIREMSKQNVKLQPITEWLAVLCASEADKVKNGWNFAEWKKTSPGQTAVQLYGEEAAVWEYLDDCHSILDHTAQYHMKVFSVDTSCLISAVYGMFIGYEQLKSQLKDGLGRHLPKLLELARAYGVEEDKYFIKLKGIERKPF